MAIFKPIYAKKAKIKLQTPPKKPILLTLKYGGPPKIQDTPLKKNPCTCMVGVCKKEPIYEVCLNLSNNCM